LVDYDNKRAGIALRSEKSMYIELMEIEFESYADLETWRSLIYDLVIGLDKTLAYDELKDDQISNSLFRNEEHPEHNIIAVYFETNTKITLAIIAFTLILTNLGLLKHVKVHLDKLHEFPIGDDVVEKDEVIKEVQENG
jgi:hypothetical protein